MTQSVVSWKPKNISTLIDTKVHGRIVCLNHHLNWRQEKAINAEGSTGEIVVLVLSCIPGNRIGLMG